MQTLIVACLLAASSLCAGCRHPSSPGNEADLAELGDAGVDSDGGDDGGGGGGKVTITTAPAKFSNSSSATFVFAGPHGVQLRCSLDGNAESDCTTTQSYDGLVEGAHAFAVRDPSGVTATASWTVDLTAPVVTLVSGPPTTFLLVFSTDDALSGVETTECKLDAAAYAPCGSPVDVTGVSNGAHTMLVRSSDRAGNVGAPLTFSWTAVVVPTFPVNCVGDGVTDDKKCIGDVVDAAVSAGGGIVVFPTGKTYFMSNGVWVGANVKIAGNQSTLRVSLVGASVLVLYGSNTIVDGIKIDYAATDYGVGIGFSNYFGPVAHLKITNSTFTGRYNIAVGIDTLGVQDVEISSNTMTGVDYGVLTNSKATDLAHVRILSNTITGVYADGIELNHPIFVAGGSGVIGVAATDILIKDNTITAPNSPSLSGGFCVGVAGATFVTIRHNNLSNCRFNGVHVEDQAQDITIADNTIATIPGDAAIGWAGSTDGIWLDRSRRITVDANVLSGAHDVGIDLSWDGTPTAFVSDVTITNNKVTASGTWGIRIGGMPSQTVNTTISGNTVSGSGTASLTLTGNPMGVTIGTNDFQ